MLEGLMQDDFPLTLHHIRRRMRDVHPGAELVTLTPQGTVRASFGEISERVDRLARALGRLGIQPGDRVGTFAWNNQRHFELYMAVPCVGAVLHTLNIRLFAEQLVYIVNHAADRVVFVDDSLVPLLEQLAPQMPGVEHFVVMGGPHGETGQLPDSGSLPNVLHYEELLAESGPAGSESFDYPDVGERQAAALCYTSGTTGNPKGVLYSHRSISLHCTASLMVDALGLSRHDRALVVVPMFHVNAWGIPHSAALAGADLVLPDRFLQAEPLARLIEAERPTIMGCVPTIFADLLRYADEHRVDISSLRNAACGGSAVPRQLMQDFQERHGVRIFQAWGMTETSPVATYSRPDEPAAGLGDAYWNDRARQGRPLPWVELRLVDDDGREVPWDNESTGEIQVRGPWIAARYFDDDTEEAKFDAGWLRTGDIAAVNRRASVQITDRSKDVIKSGGEWISSVELENELMAHPDVLEAAVIAKPDERWAERPLCCVVLRPGAQVQAAELVEHLRPRVARWWLPDEFAFIAEVPKTSVGKFDKKVLRARLRDGELQGRVNVGPVGAGG
ncbi:MAG TPA: long-chain fatty acid--CoA ligase [Solirubrobacteraceae bacterium]|nr:long-chain fatty acid--CoA ligase [Solirubrobacteraceae bacterium]